MDKINNETLKSCLNIIDTVNKKLQSAHLPRLKELSDASPRFVAVGPQSAGKSAVLTRIAGMDVKLPSQKERCTRVVTMLHFRNDKKDLPIEINVIGKDAYMETITLGDDIPGRIVKAQERAIVLEGCSTEDGFATNYFVEVKFTRNNVPNVTLVDMPGIVADNGESTIHETVNMLATEQANASGSLILFVIPCNQDFDTILGKPIVKNHANSHKSLFVITKMDTLSNAADAKAKIETIFKNNPNLEKVHIVIGEVDGKFVDTQQEDEVLKRFKTELGSAFKDEVVFGIKALKASMEQTILEHMRKQIPNVSRMTNELLVKSCEEWETIGVEPISGMVHLCKAGSTLRMLWDEDKLPRENEFRMIRDSIKSKMGALSFGNFLLGENYSTMAMNHLQPMSTQVQGLNNIANIGAQAFIEQFAPLWAEEYKKILIDAATQLNDYILKSVREMLRSKRLPTSCQHVFEDILLHNVDPMMSELQQEANKCITRLVSYNKPPLVFTTNDDHLDKTFLKLYEVDTNEVEGEGSLKSIYYRCIAYWHVQNEVIIECASKDLIGIYLTLFRNQFEAILNGLHTFADNVREPSIVVKKRNDLKDTVDMLRQVKKELDKLK